MRKVIFVFFWEKETNSFFFECTFLLDQKGAQKIKMRSR
jgi:hypothetical protein